MSKHLESLHQNLLNGKLPHNLSWSEAVELVEHLGEVNRTETMSLSFERPMARGNGGSRFRRTHSV